MTVPDYRTSYINAVRRLQATLPTDEAMKMAVGWNFTALGVVMREILIAAGLKPHHHVVDVGCGSGRLAMALSPYLKGTYLGTDVVPDLLAYARQITGRTDWRFVETMGIDIPEQDDTADLVCFFSVFTHLLHEDSFRYLIEATRVVKTDGLIVFSFLDFGIDSHWTIFNWLLDARARKLAKHHDQFLSRDIIRTWAPRLGLEIIGIRDGNAPQCHLPEDVQLEDGTLMPRDATIGQSVCIMKKA